MNRGFIGKGLLFCVVVLAAQSLRAQEVSPEQMMEKWMAFMTPGDNHKLLASRVGTWDLAVKMWQVPGGEPTESMATSESTAIMDSRYVIDKVKGEFGGMPFEGMATTGYDNGLQKFVSTWVDNMGTGIMFSEGTYDASTKTFSYAATSTDPMTGKTMKTRSTERWTGADSFVMEMFGPGPDGKEFKMMEITYKRKK